MVLAIALRLDLVDVPGFDLAVAPGLVLAAAPGLGLAVAPGLDRRNRTGDRDGEGGGRRRAVADVGGGTRATAHGGGAGAGGDGKDGANVNAAGANEEDEVVEGGGGGEVRPRLGCQALVEQQPVRPQSSQVGVLDRFTGADAREVHRKTLEVGFGFDELGVPIRAVEGVAGGGLATLGTSGGSGKISDGGAVGSWDGTEAAPVRRGGSLHPPGGGGRRGKAGRSKRRWRSPR